MMGLQEVATANEMEQKVLRVYDLLKELSVEPGAPPCVTSNSQRALAIVWQIVNDLGLTDEQLFDYGV